MLETPTASVVSIEALVRDLDVLIRARYPLVSVATFEEGRFRRLMRAVASLERHKPKGLFVWSRTQGLRQVAGPNMGVGERPIPGVEDPISILEHIAQAEAGLYILCDFGAYLVPDGLPDPPLVRQLRELAWTIKARPVTVLFVGPTFPDIPALEKEVKTIDLPLPDEREVAHPGPAARPPCQPARRAVGGERAGARAARVRAAGVDRDGDRKRSGQSRHYAPWHRH